MSQCLHRRKHNTKYARTVEETKLGIKTDGKLSSHSHIKELCEKPSWKLTLLFGIEKYLGSLHYLLHKKLSLKAKEKKVGRIYRPNTSALKTQRQISNSLSKNISKVIWHVNFQLYRVYPAWVIWKKPTIQDSYINKQVRPFIHQTIYVFKIRCYMLL